MSDAREAIVRGWTEIVEFVVDTVVLLVILACIEVIGYILEKMKTDAFLHATFIGMHDAAAVMFVAAYLADQVTSFFGRHSAGIIRRSRRRTHVFIAA